MRRLQLPVDIPSDAVGSICIDEIRIVSRLGVPHSIVKDSLRYPGPVSIWAFEVSKGIRVIVEYHQLKRIADIVCDPPDLEGALEGLGLPLDLIYWRSTAPRT
jgi:hypothetical protein